MTHDELKEKIGSFTCCSGAAEVALLAVVELHKPDTYWKGKIVCAYCNIGGFRTVLYPCPTIQAIEKELG